MIKMTSDFASYVSFCFPRNLSVKHISTRYLKKCILYGILMCYKIVQSIQAPAGDSLPPLPETDGKILKSHLKQVLNSISIEPIHNFEEMSSDALSKLALRQQLELESPTRPTCSVQGPFLFGNDTDSVDVATRVAMAKFFNSV